MLDGEPVIKCQLLTHRVGQTPPYVGLSYTWGDSGSRRSILIGSSIFHATENLVVALQHLQQDDMTVILWIDALCINQHDDVEKSEQVQRMGSIFHNAAIILAWLGPEAPESNAALQSLRAEKDRQREWVDFAEDKLHETVPVSPLLSLIERPWFKRVWVMQEVCLNRKTLFICGRTCVEKGSVIYGITLFGAALARISPRFLTPIYSRFASRREKFTNYFSAKGTSVTLGFGAYLEASEPRDFVYSHFGMISDLEAIGLKVDYNKPVHEIYTDLAEAMVRYGCTTDVGRVWMPSRNYPALPSWVPDWSNTRGFGKSPIYEDAEILKLGDGRRVMKTTVRLTDKICQIHYDMESPLFEIQGTLSTDLGPELQAAAVQLLFAIEEAISSTQQFPEISVEKDKAVCKLSIDGCLSKTWSTLFKDETIYESYISFRSSGCSFQDKNSQPYLNLFCTSNVSQVFITEGNNVGTSCHKIQAGDIISSSSHNDGFALRPDDVGSFKLLSRLYLLKAPEGNGCEVKTIHIS